MESKLTVLIDSNGKQADSIDWQQWKASWQCIVLIDTIHSIDWQQLKASDRTQDWLTAAESYLAILL